MVTELDIHRTSHMHVREHGADAPIQAAMRRDELLEASDFDGCSVWKRVPRAVDVLLADQSEGTVH